MKIVSGIILLTLLNTACGGQKNKNQTPAQSSAKAFSPTPVFQAKNKLTAAETYVSAEGKEFVAIAKISRNEIGELASESKDNLISVGNLSAKWEMQTYPAQFEGKEPKPALLTEDKNYPKLNVYFAPDPSHSEDVFVVIQKNDASQIAAQRNSAQLSFNYQMGCLQYLLKWTTAQEEASERNHSTYQLTYNGALANCESLVSCQVRVTDAVQLPISIEEIKNVYPLSICKSSGSLPTQIVSVTNTAEVKSYEIIMNEQFKSVAAKVRF